jgi:hypothetical protein
MTRLRHRETLRWIWLAYLGVIAIVLYPAFHEGFGVGIAVWNCVPPTLGLVVVLTSLGKSRYRIVVSAIFASVTGATAIFFFASWFFTSLDLDPHSFTTKLVFIYAPIFSVTLGGLGAFIGWLAATDSRSTTAPIGDRDR